MDPLSNTDLLEHADFLKRLACRLVQDEHRAEDLVQDAQLAALTRAPRDRGALRGWLAGVMRHLSSNARRPVAGDVDAGTIVLEPHNRRVHGRRRRGLSRDRGRRRPGWPRCSRCTPVVPLSGLRHRGRVTRNRRDLELRRVSRRVGRDRFAGRRGPRRASSRGRGGELRVPARARPRFPPGDDDARRTAAPAAHRPRAIGRAGRGAPLPGRRAEVDTDSLPAVKVGEPTALELVLERDR